MTGLSSDDVVDMSRDLPEVLIKEWKTYTNITFKGKGFAWVNHQENHAMIKGNHDEREALLATNPDAYEAGWATQSSAWVTVHLEYADPDEVRELLEEGWRMTATKKAIAAWESAQSGFDQ
jgi:hypothetical protein